MNKMKNLRKLMQSKDITQINLSMAIEVSQETISAYLNGKAKPKIETLLKLAEYFNCTTDYLLDRTDVNINPNELSLEKISDIEFNLVNQYRSLADTNKIKLESYLRGLSDK